MLLLNIIELLDIVEFSIMFGYAWSFRSKEDQQRYILNNLVLQRKIILIFVVQKSIIFSHHVSRRNFARSSRDCEQSTGRPIARTAMFEGSSDKKPFDSDEIDVEYCKRNLMVEYKPEFQTQTIIYFIGHNTIVRELTQGFIKPWLHRNHRSRS